MARVRVLGADRKKSGLCGDERSDSSVLSFVAVFRNVTQRSPKGTAAHIGTTFLSRIEPIQATVPFFGTVSLDSTNNTSRFINALDHHKYAGLLFVFFKATALTMSAIVSGELKE